MRRFEQEKNRLRSKRMKLIEKLLRASYERRSKRILGKIIKWEGNEITEDEIVMSIDIIGTGRTDGLDKISIDEF